MRRLMGQLPVIVALAACSSPSTAADPAPLVERRLDAGFVQNFVLTDGGRLSCYRRRGNGPPLLLIPGTFSDARNYARTTAALDPSIDVLVLENRGLGGSWPPPEHSSIEDCAADALLVLDSLGVPACYVGGHSLGGMIAIELARRSPDRLLGIISIEGWTNSQAAADAFQSDMKSTLSEAQLAESAAYRADVLRRWTPEQRSMFGSIWRQWDGADVLKHTSLPVLELYGDRNKPRPALELLGIPERENIQVVWFAGASHSLLVERPGEVAREINRFIVEIHQGDLGDAPQ